MACCCTKISKCNSDISKITSARSSLQTLKSNNGTLDTKLSELGGKMQEMASPDNMGSCVSSIKNLNKDSSSAIDAMIKQCSSKISSLQTDKTKYEKEDKEYHQKPKK
jgi:conjugal transfer/entry exclusion protein